MMNELIGYRISPQQSRFLNFYKQSQNLVARLSFETHKDTDLDKLKNAIKNALESALIFKTKYHSYSEPTSALQVPGEKVEIEFLEGRAKDSLGKFDLNKETLIQVNFINQPDNSYLTTISCPAIVADIWTLDLLIQKIFDYYEGSIQPLEEQLEYIQFSEWQNQLLEEDEMQDSLKYWRNKLFPSYQAQLSFDKNPEGTKEFIPKQHSFEIEGAQLNSVLKSNSDFTLAEVVSAIWYTLLWRLMGNNNFLIGQVNSFRQIEELQNLCGFCSKTLPMYWEWNEAWSIQDLLKQVKLEHDTVNEHKEAFTDQNINIPYVFEYQENDTINLSGSRNTFNVLNKVSISECFKLKLVYKVREENYHFELQYDSNAFSAKAIEFIADAYQQLLSELINNNSKTLLQLNLLSENYKTKILNEFNKQAEAFPKSSASVLDLFENVVENYPDHIALFSGNIQLTYKELYQKASQLAHYLQTECQIKSGNLVGVMCGKNENLIVSLLGVIMSGAGFVPVDPNNPEQRVNFILNDSQIKVLLSESSLEEQTKHVNIPVLFIDELQFNSGEISNVLKRKAEDVLYVIYTSGTTGNPKGTVICDKSLVNYIWWLTNQFEIDADDSSVLLGSYAFDLGYTSIWGTLLNGGSIHLIPDEMIKEPDTLLQYFINHDISFIKTTPSLFHAITSSSKFNDLKESKLRLLFSGGEPIRTKDLQKLLQIKSDVILVNHYGPTESTIGTIAHQIDATQLDDYALHPVIGSPIPNSAIYIVDENNCLVPPGIEGEVLIAGTGLAKGYLNNDTLTAEKFVSSPFVAGQQVYRTGDLAQWMPDGTILFSRRKDDQVKIRGYRVELNEIQHALQDLQEINSALVISRDSAEYGSELVAYFTFHQQIDTEGIRAHLLEKLPDFMVPSFFVPLDKFPLTPNGKVDKKALPEPDVQLLSSSYVAPRNELENKIMALWEDVLERKNIGVYDDFFTIGGHSLKAIKLISRFYKSLDCKIALQDVFIYSTIARQAEYLSDKVKTDFTPIITLREQAYYDLSHSQHRLWILDQLEQNQVAYNVPGAFVMEGRLDFEAFNKAFQTLVQRHEILRTTFISVNGEPKQRVHKTDELPFLIKQIDLKEKKNKEQVARIFAEKEANTPFELEKGPLLRASLLQMEDERFVFVFNMHHIISDGWSLKILIEEILTLYKAFKQGKENPLTPLTVQYKDYANWQNTQLEQESIKEAQQYWWNTFEDGVPLLELPTDYPRPAIQTFNGTSSSIVLNAELSKKLATFTQEQSATPFITLLASINALLYHYSEQEDMVFGSPVAGREHPDLENLIGFFVNTLPIRTRFNASESFEKLVQTVKENTLKAQQYQLYPFDRLVDDLNLERDMSRSAIFDVMVSYSASDSAGNEFESFDDLKVKVFENHLAMSKFDLSFDFQESPQGIKLSIEYNSDLFMPARIERMLGHYQKMLSEMMQNTKLPLQELDILLPVEVTQLLEEFNATTVHYNTEKTIVQSFYDQVEKTPEAIALSFENKALTYTQLNEQSNQLAHYLGSQLSLHPDMRVGLLLGRSERMLTGVLAVLKIGAAYVPIDPEYPLERIEYLIQESGIEILITDSIETLANSTVSVNVINLNDFQESINANSVANPTTLINPDSVAYVIFTSGSTGNPKGVMVTHRNLSNIASSWCDSYKLSEFNPNLLQLASISFDVFMGDVCRCLLNGGKMVVCPGDFRGDAIALYDLIQQHQINILETTPAIILPLMHHVYENNLDVSFMKLLILGSDSVLAEDFRWLMQCFSNQMRIINSYGTTETTIDSSFFEAPLSELPKEGNVPIGKPMHNTCYFILNKSQKLNSVGVIGELYIGGAGVSKGYLNREELNEERFIYLPSAIHQQKVYKTGDRACWLPDGNVAFYGRNDNQVKVRGYRIELGEIENTILQHPSVNSVAVLAKPDHDGHNRLIAYCSLKDDEAILEVKESIKNKLPDYMIPSAFIVLDKLPLTPNGKINHKALPNPSTEALRNLKDFIAPQTVTEQKLATIWERVLKVTSVGNNDHFFELGGHSLKATQLISQIYKEFGASIQLRDIFTHTTLADQAQLIDSKEKNEFKKINPIPAAEDYPLSLAQNRLWIQDQMEGGMAAYNIIDAFEMEGELHISSLENAFNEVVGRHESLRTIFAVRNGEPRQIIQPKEKETISIVYQDLRNQPNAEELAQQLVEKASTTVFDLEQGPLVRALLLQLEDEKHVFILTMHHIISDGWSSEVFQTELMGLYHAFMNGQQSPLAPLTVQYKDYAVWHRGLLNGENLENLQNYWRNQFSDEIQTLNLLTDKPRSKTKTYNGSILSFELDKGLSQRLQEFSKQQGLSLYMTLLGFVKVLLHKYTGQEDIIIGSPVSGRVHSDLDPQIGFYVNSLALRTHPKPDQTFIDFLQSLKKVVLDAQSHQLYPFESLVQDLKLDYHPNRSPITDVWMQLYNQEIEADSQILGGLKVKEFEVNRVFSKNDITFNFLNKAGIISAFVNYNTDLFEKDTILKIQDDLVLLMSKLTGVAGIKLSEIELVVRNESSDAFLESMFNI